MNFFMSNILCKFIYALLLLLGGFFLRSHLLLNAQTQRPELEKLVQHIVEPLTTKLSPDGKHVLLFEIDEGSKVSLVISETQKPFRKIRKTNVSKSFFVNDHLLVLQVGNTIQEIELPSGKESEIKHVKNVEFFETSKLLLIHYDQTKNNLVEVYDARFNLKQRIDSVTRWKETGNDLIVFQSDGADKNLLEISSDGKSFKKIWSSGYEVYLVAKSDMKKWGYIVSVSAAKGLKTYFIHADLSSVQMDDVSINGYDHVSIEESSDVNAVFLTLSKKVPLDNKMVSIWYGNEKDLSKYFYGDRIVTHVLWYPEQDKVVRLDSDYTGYSGIGKSNLFLRQKIDQSIVDIKDNVHKIDRSEMYLWNSETGDNQLLEKDGDVMYFDKEGHFILRYIKNIWKILDTRTMVDRIIDMDGEAIPCFTTKGTVLWSSNGELWEQDLTNLKKKKLLSVKMDRIEILNNIKKTRGSGAGRKHHYVDDSYILMAAHNDHDLNSMYFIYDYRKMEIVVPQTTDRIRNLNISKNGRNFLWIEENYNKTPLVKVKRGSSLSNTIYAFNSIDSSVKLITKKQLYYKGVNGEDLQASLFIPADFDPQKKYPVVVWIYEKQQEFTDKYLKPTFMNSRGFNARLLLESGYMVLMPDINYGERGPVLSALECVNNVLNELQKIEEVDMEKIALIGQSFGGYQTNFIATKSNRFAAYISGVSVSDIVHMFNSFNYNYHAPDYRRFEDGQFRMGVSFEDNKQKYFDNNPLYHASAVNAPMLLWSGSKDLNISPEETRTFFNALRKYRKPVIALFYKDEAHTLIQYSSQKDFTSRMLDWFDYFLNDKRNIPWIDKQMKDAF